MNLKKYTTLLLASTMTAFFAFTSVQATSDASVSTKQETTKPAVVTQKVKSKKRFTAKTKVKARFHDTIKKVTYYKLPLSNNLQNYIRQLCIKYGVSERLVYSVMGVETGGTYNPNLISSTGDYGLLQINLQSQRSLMQKLGVSDLLNPFQNVKIGIYLLGSLTKQYHNTSEVLLSYHLGPNGMLHAIRNGIWSTDYTLKAFHYMNILKVSG